MGETVKRESLYSKKENLLPGKNKITYSTDVRDFYQVARSIPCQHACPAITNIPGYIQCINEKRYGRAYELNRKANILPGVLGRICSRPCEAACRHSEPDNGESVSICHLKRSCADLKSPLHRIIEGLYAPSGKTVAVVGAGPAGLAVAHDLAIMGHKTVIYESMEKPGGMLMYGIPEFRLPRDELMTEISNVLRLGIELKTSHGLGKEISIEGLQKQFNAVVVATGCIKPKKLGICGEEFENVYNGLEFMKAINAGNPPFTGDKVLVIGAGFTAVDCARSAVRMGASDVTINIRKTVEFMKIDETEKHETSFEGINIHSLVQPSRIIGTNNRATAIEFQRTRLKTIDKPPYRISIPIEGSKFTVPCDCVIAALGQSPDILPYLGNMAKNSHTTDINEVFAAGDFITGASDVISAISGGRQCAKTVDKYLTGMTRKKNMVKLESQGSTNRPRSWDFIPKTSINTIDMDQRVEKYTNEVETGYNDTQTSEESKRCYLCHLKYEIDPLKCIYCSACIDAAPKNCIKMINKIPVKSDGTYGEYIETSKWNNVVAITIDNDLCIRCGQCYEVCPMDCISVTKTELIEIDMDN